VEIMIAHMYIEQGLAKPHNEEVFAAHALFKQSYDLHEALSHRMGEHILVEPMSMLANTYSMLSQFDKSLPLYQRYLSPY
jgi:hypothetical protein